MADGPADELWDDELVPADDPAQWEAVLAGDGDARRSRAGDQRRGLAPEAKELLKAKFAQDPSLKAHGRADGLLKVLIQKGYTDATLQQVRDWWSNHRGRCKKRPRATADVEEDAQDTEPLPQQGPGPQAGTAPQQPQRRQRRRVQLQQQPRLSPADLINRITPTAAGGAPPPPPSLPPPARAASGAVASPLGVQHQQQRPSPLQLAAVDEQQQEGQQEEADTGAASQQQQDAEQVSDQRVSEQRQQDGTHALVVPGQYVYDKLQQKRFSAAKRVIMKYAELMAHKFPGCEVALFLSSPAGTMSMLGRGAGFVSGSQWEEIKRLMLGYRTASKTILAREVLQTQQPAARHTQQGLVQTGYHNFLCAKRRAITQQLAGRLGQQPTSREVLAEAAQQWRQLSPVEQEQYIPEAVLSVEDILAEREEEQQLLQLAALEEGLDTAADYGAGPQPCSRSAGADQQLQQAPPQGQQQQQQQQPLYRLPPQVVGGGRTAAASLPVSGPVFQPQQPTAPSASLGDQLRRRALQQAMAGQTRAMVGAAVQPEVAPVPARGMNMPSDQLLTQLGGQLQPGGAVRAQSLQPGAAASQQRHTTATRHSARPATAAAAPAATTQGTTSAPTALAATGLHATRMPAFGVGMLGGARVPVQALAGSSDDDLGVPMDYDRLDFTREEFDEADQADHWRGVYEQQRMEEQRRQRQLEVEQRRAGIVPEWLRPPEDLPPVHTASTNVFNAMGQRALSFLGWRSAGSTQQLQQPQQPRQS